MSEVSIQKPRNKDSFSLFRVLVGVFVALVVLFYLFAPTTRHEIGYRIVCGVNLRSLGTTMQFYASDYNTSLFSQIGSKFVGISPGLDNPLDDFTIFKHDQGLKFIIPKEAYSPGQSIEFIDDPKGEKIIIDSHQGKVFRFKFTY